ncbi:hypothetical protein MUK70_28230 [Dyadobacter chenwenxiniae]|uniref:Anti-sigma factor n=1 Tax=Dyadobacter chenwenxiniae TaxID=2906456 RepID=A0A9X1PN29_9BACT|nr:hypothetical protein [Dyadobacter chenwenxiniae]MCF0064170.1 hypothetical protein [Dyadobacter chenwenxiniae]UON82897.1 hypothetical protein MUK70_28230 [Dyadobacter chenwenxiniae]
MGTNDFIESGILEAHLLGLTNEDEKELVKQMVEENQEVKEHLVDIESDITRYFNGAAVTPPSALREIIHLRSNQENFRKEKHTFKKKAEEDQNTRFLDVEVNDTHIKVHKFWRPAFIAVFILSKIFLIAGLYYYFKAVNQEEQIQKLKTEIQQVK